MEKAGGVLARRKTETEEGGENRKNTNGVERVSPLVLELNI